MKTHHNIKNDEEETNNFLSSLNQQNPFSVPESYFDYLPQDVMDRIIAKEKEKKIFFVFKPSVAIPSFTVLSGIIIMLFFFFNQKTPHADENIISENEIRQIIENHDLYNIDESIITEQYISSNIADEYVNKTGLSEEEIKNYLEENTDINNIINQL